MKTFFLILLLSSIAIAQPFKSDTARYLHVAHLENWFIGTIPPDSIPYKYITDLIMFDGFTFGKLTNPTYPYFGMPTDLTVDPWGQGFPAYWAKVIRLAHLNGVKMIIDLGQNSNNGFHDVCAIGLPAMRDWAGTVAHALIQYNFDGGDFDAEGGQYPPNGGMGVMAQLLRDSLLALNPSKHYDITCSMMTNLSDVQGYLTGINGAAASLVTAATAAFDIISPMFYDQAFPTPSPLYKSSTHSCWSNDSDRMVVFQRAGIPKNKLGIGYAIQVYDGCYSCLQYFNSMIKYFPGATIYHDLESKETWFVGNGHTIAYEDDYSGWWKADYVQRNGLRGGMGFCIGRGYLPAAGRPVGWDANPAVAGFGKPLYGNRVTVIDTSPPPPPPPPPVVRPVLAGFQFAKKSTQTFLLGLSDREIVMIHPYAGDITLQAIDSGHTAASVAFTVNGNNYTTNGPPFFYGWPFNKASGMLVNSENVIRATAWSGANATGSASATLAITVYISDDSLMNPPPMPQCFSQAQLDSAKATVVCPTCPPFPDTAGIRAAAYLQGKRDEWDLIPNKPPRP